MSDTSTLLRLVDGKAAVRIEPAYYRGLDGFRVIVDVGGGRIPADTVTEFRPEVNEAVQVLFVDGKPYMLGPTVPKPGEGTVLTAPAGGFVNVATDIGNFSCTYPNGATLSSGQKVKLYWSSGPHVISVMSNTPVAPIDPGPGGTPGQQRSQVFTAITAGSWQLNGSRWIDGEPRASNGYLGAWHYGTKMADTIPAGAINGRIEVFIRYAERFGNAPVFALHNQPSRGGAPGFSGDVAWAPPEGWQPLPDAVQALYFNSLKAGGGAFGIGLNHGGQNRFMSLGADPQSGALRISWFS